MIPPLKEMSQEVITAIIAASLPASDHAIDPTLVEPYLCPALLLTLNMILQDVDFTQKLDCV
jgi:hypothetical protein